MGFGGKELKKQVRRILAWLISLVGTLLAIYIGGYWLLFRPVRFLYLGFLAGSLTKKSFFVCIVKIFFASTAAGGIWSVFDIIAGHFRDDPQAI